eukprot:1008386-Ditylum_brightwellii.AAC.1
MTTEADFAQRSVGPQRLIVGCLGVCFAAFLLMAWMWRFSCGCVGGVNDGCCGFGGIAAMAMAFAFSSLCG